MVVVLGISADNHCGAGGIKCKTFRIRWIFVHRVTSDNVRRHQQTITVPLDVQQLFTPKKDKPCCITSDHTAVHFDIPECSLLSAVNSDPRARRSPALISVDHTVMKYNHSSPIYLQGLQTTETGHKPLLGNHRPLTQTDNKLYLEHSQDVQDSQLTAKHLPDCMFLQLEHLYWGWLLHVLRLSFSPKLYKKLSQN